MHKLKSSIVTAFRSPSLLLQSLVDIVNKIRHMSHGGKPGSVIKRDSTIISGQGGLGGAEKPFDAMNNIVANLLLNITRYRITVCSYTVNPCLLRERAQMSNVFFFFFFFCCSDH